MSISLHTPVHRPFSVDGLNLVYAAITLVLILAGWVGLGARTPVVLILLVAGVVFSGLPHGSLDPLVARKLFGQDRRFTMFRFLLAYVALAAACAFGWLAFPDVALCVFLMASALHFGSDWQGRAKAWGQAAYGFCVISISTLRHAPEVRQIFSALGATASTPIVSGLRAVAGFAILCAVISLLWRSRRRTLDGIELAVIIVSGLALPPLLFFVCYFCLLHSPRHLLLTARQLGLQGAVRILAATAPLVLVTLALAGLLWRFLPASDATSHLLQITFIGLAALTAPHMLLCALSERDRPPAHSY